MICKILKNDERVKMTIAIPLNKSMVLYHSNPITAQKFAIYNLKSNKSGITVALQCVVNNPWVNSEPECFTEEKVTCNCSIEQQNDMQHISHHYTLLDAIGGCSYLLADHYCHNTMRTLRNGGVSIYKVPPIIKQVNHAIANFIIGASLASTAEYIHHAS